MTNSLTGHDVEEGELPSGWSLCQFSEIANVDSNLVDPKPLGHLPHIAPNNIESDSGRLLQYRSTAEDGVTSGKHKFQRGHILYSKIRPYLNKVVVVDFEGLCSADMYPISTDQNISWLWMAMLSPSFVSQTSSTQTRTVLPKINIKELSRIEIPVPPLSEQERIVEILEDQLSRLDTALHSVHTVQKKAAQFRRSLLHAAFTGALTGHDVKDGELPEGWRRLELGVLGKWTTGSTPSTRDPENFDGDVPFVGPGDIGYGNLLGNVQRSLSAQGQKKARIVEPPSVLLVCIGATLGKVSLAMRRVATNQQINALEVGEDLSPSFVMHLLASPSLQESLWGTSSSTTVPIINKKTLQGVEVPIPPLGEQERIVEIVEEQLSRLDASLAVADAVEERSAALRRSLLYSAFTGRLTEEWREAVNV